MISIDRRRLALVSCFISAHCPLSRSYCFTRCCSLHCVARLVYTHEHTFNGPLSGTTQVSQYQKGKTCLDFTGARDSERQCYHLGLMQVCTSLQTDNHASTSLLKLLDLCTCNLFQYQCLHLYH